MYCMTRTCVMKPSSLPKARHNELQNETLHLFDILLYFLDKNFNELLTTIRYQQSSKVFFFALHVSNGSKILMKISGKSNLNNPEKYKEIIKVKINFFISPKPFLIRRI